MCFVIDVVNTPNSMDCRYISVGKPNCTHHVTF